MSLEVISCSSLCRADGYVVWYWQVEEGKPVVFSQPVAAWVSCQVEELGSRYCAVLAFVPDDCGGLQPVSTANNFLGVSHESEPIESWQHDAQAAWEREEERRQAAP